MNFWSPKANRVWFLTIFLVLSPPQRILIDDLGHHLELDHPPQRIISLAPNITEILFALELEDRLVAVTQFCNFPPEAQKKPHIGGYINPQLEKIISFHPDLILGFRGNPLPLIQQLQALHLPIFVLDEGHTILSLLSMIQRLGQATFQEKKAAVLMAKIKNQLEQLNQIMSQTQRRPRVLLLLAGTQLWTCGRDTFLNDLIARAGGENIMKHIHRAWFVAQLEDLITKNPEIIILLAPNQTVFKQRRHALTSLPLFQQIQAVKKGNIYYLNEDLVSRLSPRIIKALYQLAQILHPELKLSLIY
ncbi:MAG: hypothetical protein DRI99_05225 [Candidatus Aminicenantes bacterium]|nr:MAG: hypothetical protein DRI99_05225 [Candidatus Aminicenantes bacterium]